MFIRFAPFQKNLRLFMAKMALFGHFLLIITLLCSATQPNLSPKETRIKIEEILAAHVNSPQIDEHLLKKAYENYLDEIDGTKTYLLASEIASWQQPSSEALTTAVKALKHEDFSHFMAIRDLMKEAIIRRARLEELVDEKTAKGELPVGVKPTDFDLKTLKWTVSEEELLQRLLTIRALQLETTEKLGDDVKTHFLARMQKRRLKREEDFLLSGKNGDKHNLALTLKSIASALDSQTAYFTPHEANQFMIQVQQRLFGIGASLRDDLTGFTMVQLIDGSPAAKSGKLQPMDKIIAVGGEPVVGMEIAEAVELIRGAEGTPVNLTILRESSADGKKSEEKLDVEIIRGEIVLKESRFEVNFEPFGDGIVAHLHLHSFYQDQNSSSAADLREAIETLKKEHIIKGILLDLRNNGGGLLSQAVEVTGLFIKKGVVVSVKDNTGRVQHLRNTTSNPVWTGPLLVLINRGSASASEIVAGTLQDYGRSLVIGDASSYGKGSFQTFTLESSQFGKIDSKGEYKVSRGRYYTVSGKSPQLTGVKADIVIPGILANLEVGEEFSKYPLSSDALHPNFEDDLSDIPLISRGQVRRMYKFDLQPILTNYKNLLPKLKKNSELRIENNGSYKTFIKMIAKEDFDSEGLAKFTQNDLQYTEAMHALKDLILFTEPSPATPIR